MKIKTSELSGEGLDWAVAKCEGGVVWTFGEPMVSGYDGLVDFTPTTDWAQAGPIIEREQMDITWVEDNNCQASNGIRSGEGPTPLIAAMRCHVLMYLGDEVDVPEELIGE